MKMELYILIGLITIVLILQIVFLLKKPKSENTATNTNYESNFQHIETYIADEFSRSQKETSRAENTSKVHSHFYGSREKKGFRRPDRKTFPENSSVDSNCQSEASASVYGKRKHRGHLSP